jgi:hypothetical protein
VLNERDELRIGDRVFVLSTESALESVPFDGTSRKVSCARCKSPLSRGEQVVYCPGCKSPHHAECFHYGPRCAGCTRETTVAPWVPEPFEKEGEGE